MAIVERLRMAAVMRRETVGVTSGFASAAQRRPDRPGLVGELGTLTWRQIDERSREITILEKLPRGSTGKVLRNGLNARVGADDS